MTRTRRRHGQFRGDHDAGGHGAGRGRRSGTPAGSVDPQRLRRRLAGDLDNIVLKALSKEPARRYASVDQFSEDIRRHLAGLPVTRAQGHVRLPRREVRAAATAPASRPRRWSLVALIAGIVGTTWQARAARRERARAEQRFEDVRQLANAALFEIHDAIRDLPGIDAGPPSARLEGPRVPRPAGARRGRSARPAARARGRLHQGRRRPGAAAQCESRRHRRRAGELPEGRRHLRIDRRARPAPIRRCGASSRWRGSA